MVKKTQKIFTISKDGLNRLKTLSGISNNSWLQRKIFVKDIDTKVYFRTVISDIPDDFKMPIYDINSFIGTYKMIENSAIDYTDLETDGFVKIINNDLDSKSKEFFIYNQNEECLMKNNLPIEFEEKMNHPVDPKTKMPKEIKTNTFILTQDNIKKLSKACSVIDANCIKFITEDDSITIKAINTKIQNTNVFELNTTLGLNVELEKLSFELFVELFNKLDKEIDEYTVKLLDSNGKKLMTFENEDVGYKFYFAEYTGKKS
jgi:hypothetical protein